MKHRILYVEDDPVSREGVGERLTAKGYQVVLKETIADAQEWLEKKTPDLALLDLNLPDGNGLDLCREIHRMAPEVPILMLTTKTDEDTAVRALSIGAVDFLRKPVGMMELLTKIQKLLKETTRLQVGDLVLDLSSHSAHVGETEVKLRRREFQYLAALMKFPGEVISRSRLQELAEQDPDAHGRTIDSHISRLRGALEKAGLPESCLQSVYGEGYRLNATDIRLSPPQKKSA